MKYAYFLSENLETDCFSTSFDLPKREKLTSFLVKSDIVNFLGWDFNFYLSKTYYIVFDETNSHSISFNLSYKNSGNIQYFKFEKVEEDRFRNILTVRLLDEMIDFDVRKFKRDVRIEKLLE